VRLRGLLIPVLIGALLAGFAATAGAETYGVTTANKYFCCTNPGNIVVNAHTATGLATGSPATPYGPLHFDKSQVAYFMNFMSRWSDYPAHGTTGAPPGFKYIIGVNSWVNTSGTIMSGGGYGSFEFCPKAKGPGPGACSDPALATPTGFNGRISVKAGAKQFGGTMQLVKGIGGKGGAFSDIWRWIGGSMTYPAAVVYNKLYLNPVGGAPAQVTDITAASALITHTAGSGTSAIASFPSVMLFENGAGPFTTGTVYVGATQNGTPPMRTVSIMGANNRTAMGGGNLQLVSGLLFNSYNVSKSGSFPIGYSLDMTLPEPSANLGLAAGSVALLLIGLVAARRGSRNRQDP